MFGCSWTGTERRRTLRNALIVACTGVSWNYGVFHRGLAIWRDSGRDGVFVLPCPERLRVLASVFHIYVMSGVLHSDAAIHATWAYTQLFSVSSVIVWLVFEHKLAPASRNAHLASERFLTLVLFTAVQVLGGLIQRLKKDNFDSPLMSERPVEKVLLVVMTGDRGLCGG